jgi:N-acetylmuramoyl-L-alanine amidase
MKITPLVSCMLLLLTASACMPYPKYPTMPVYEPVGVQVPIYEPPCQPTEVAGKLIVLDPGHGGKDLGAHSLTAPRYQEKLLTLSTARIVKNYLEGLGHTVIMTRTEDVFIPLEKRASLANQLAPSLFVSIHYNSAENVSAEGIEIFYYTAKDNSVRTRDSKLLAQTILDEVLKCTGAKSRGVKTQNFSVIRNTKMPAVLIEGGFLTNNDERQRVKNAAYLKKLAWGIALGIDRFLKE